MKRKGAERKDCSSKEEPRLYFLVESSAFDFSQKSIYNVDLWGFNDFAGCIVGVVVCM